MNNSNFRMENAKLAKAYIAGGTTPFNAAKMTGFRNVPDMEDAMAALERNETREEMKPQNASAFTKGMVATGEWRSRNFLVKRFAANDTYPEMIRVFAGGRISYIYFEPEWGKELINIIAEATGLQGESSCESKSNEELEKAEAEIKRLQKALVDANENLVRAIQRPQPDQTGLEKDLEEQKMLNQKLKDKLVELLLEV